VVFYPLICLALGAGLAQRFKFMAMGPVVAVVLVAAVSSGMAQADTLSRIFLVSAADVASLQIGYFIGLAIRFLPRPPVSGTARPFRPDASSARHSAP
jgi:hypothetical protein